MASTTVKTENLKSTMRLLTRVLQKCEEEKTQANTLAPLENYIDRAEIYTGLHKNVLLQIAGLFESECDSIVSMKLKEIDRNVIQDELVKTLLNGYLPTTKQLYSILQKKIPAYVDIRTFRTQLLKYGYIWKKIEGYTWVVIENPAVTFERYHYLAKMIEYIEENRPIIYIDVINILNKTASRVGESKSYENLESSSTFYIYAISKYEILALKEIEVFSEEVYKYWIENELSTHIPPKSVVVLNHFEYNKEQIVELPSKDSSKTAMIAWLEYHNIPCNRSMAKFELSSLVEKFTNSLDKLYKIDHILKVYGHSEPMHLPESIQELTPANLVREFIQNKLKTLKAAVVFDNITKEHLEVVFNYIDIKIRTLFDRDQNADNIFDDACERMKSYQAEEKDFDSDLPYDSDSD